MKKAILLKGLSILILCLMTHLDSFATHITGAEISYTNLSGNKYQFKLKVYRDCKECKFNNSGGGDNPNNCNEVPDLQVKGALGSVYSGFDFGTIQIVRKSITDLTPVCASATGKCKPGSNANYGYEVHEFEGTFDFSELMTQGYCEFDVSIGMSSRNININTQRSEQNFFNYTYLNICSGANQSTEFSNTPQFIRNVNQPVSEALGIKNPDGDSLHFALRPALVSRTNNVIYANSRNYNYPFSFVCSGSYPCAVNLNAPVPEGFYCSEQTGDVIFTPNSSGQGGVVVVECEEWKKDRLGKYYLAGVTRRDIYSEVISLNNNSPKFKNRLDQITICEGDNSAFDVPVEDQPAPGQIQDTIYAELSSNLSSATLITKYINIAPYRSYSVSLGNTKGMAGTYFVTLTLRDVACPIRAVVSKTIKVEILKSRELVLNSSVKNCGMFDVSSSSIGNTSVYWTIQDPDGRIIHQSYARKASVQLQASGKFVVKSRIPAGNGYCQLDQIDTILVKHFQKPVLDMGPDIVQCLNSEITFKATNFVTYNPYKFYINGIETALPYKTKLSRAENYSFKIIQDDGCVIEDNVRISPFAALKYKIVNDSVCSGVVFPKRIGNIVSDYSNISKVNLTVAGGNVTLNKVNEKEWTYTPLGGLPQQLRYRAQITDVNGCSYDTAFSTLYMVPEPINVSITPTICVNAPAYNLPKSANGEWKCLNKPELVVNNVFKPEMGFVQSANLVYTEKSYCVNSKSFVIQVVDTTPLMFDHASRIELCRNMTPFELKAYPGGGDWYGENVSRGFFNTSAASGKNTEVTYIYSNLSGCVSRAGFTINVIDLPELKIAKTKDKICVGDVLSLRALTTFLGDGYWYTDGQGRFEEAGKPETRYLPSRNDIFAGDITFTYTIQTNGICGNVSESVKVNVRDGQTGGIIDNYPLEVCEPLQAEFSTDYKRLEKQYWYINDSLVEEFDYNFSIRPVLSAGEYVIKTIVRDSVCEAMSISKPITVLPKPKIEMFSNPSQKISKEYPNLYLRDYSYCKYGNTTKWYYNYDEISTEKEKYIKVDTDKDTFRITLVSTSNKGACQDSITRLFWFSPINQLYIPDAFTPDSKGPTENNTFRVYGPAMKIYKIEIFNRFGEIVYRSTDMNAVWDGSYIGQICPNGVYFYKIQTEDFEGVGRDYSGTVTLIR